MTKHFVYGVLGAVLLAWAAQASATPRIGSTFGRWINGEYNICEWVTTTQVVCYPG